MCYVCLNYTKTILSFDQYGFFVAVELLTKLDIKMEF